jgi:TolA-binding protein
MSLVGGCSSNQYDLCLQEREQLQQKVDAQQVQIDELEGKVDETSTLDQKMSTQLQQCNKERIKLRRARATKTVSKAGNPNPKRVPKKTSKTTKKKSGCPCRRKPKK